MLKLLENWEERKCSCQVCGSCESVKYELDVIIPVKNGEERPMPSPVCNKCAFTYGKRLDKTTNAGHVGIMAIRIYYDEQLTPMADLKFADHTIHTICWVNKYDKSLFADYINGYTLIYDERKKVPFEKL